MVEQMQKKNIKELRLKLNFIEKVDEEKSNVEDQYFATERRKNSLIMDKK